MGAFPLIEDSAALGSGILGIRNRIQTDVGV
jgi:hypothetical protein